MRYSLSVQSRGPSILNQVNLKFSGCGFDRVLSRAKAKPTDQPGLTGRRQRALVAPPAGNAWKVRIAETPGSLTTIQGYIGVVQSQPPARYTSLSDS